MFTFEPFNPSKKEEAQVVDLKEYRETGRLPRKEETAFEKAIEQYEARWITSEHQFPVEKPKTAIQREIEAIERFQNELLRLFEDFQERLAAMSSPNTGSLTKKAVWKLLKQTSSEMSACRRTIEMKKENIKALARNGGK